MLLNCARCFSPACTICVYCQKAGVTVRLVLGRTDYLTVETPEIKSVPPCACFLRSRRMSSFRRAYCLWIVMLVFPWCLGWDSWSQPRVETPGVWVSGDWSGSVLLVTSTKTKDSCWTEIASGSVSLFGEITVVVGVLPMTLFTWLPLKLNSSGVCWLAVVAISLDSWTVVHAV